jgi:hypothetical protein
VPPSVYSTPPPPPLRYTLAALLLRQRSVSLEALLPHLSPSLEEMATSHAAQVCFPSSSLPPCLLGKLSNKNPDRPPPLGLLKLCIRASTHFHEFK